jgi:hypothetical protein
MRRINLSAIIGVIVLAGIGQVLGQIEDKPPQILGSPFHIERPVKVPLDNGGHKLVYKNNAGFTFRIIEYAPAGGMFQVVRMVKDSHVVGYGREGKLYSVRIETYQDDPNKIGEVERATSIEFTYEEGKLTEKQVYRVENGYAVSGLRTITRYTDQNPQGITQREKRVPGTVRDWVKASPYEGTTWSLEVDGKKQTGAYTFEEGPSITAIRHDSKTWLLMFNSQIEKRSVVLPAESKDHLGFAGKLIQLRGSADAGRLEFWLTPDLTVGEFQKTRYVLVREDN